MRRGHELLAAMGGEPLIEPRRQEFISGRRRRFWDKNVVALGSASGFLEPLAATDLHLTTNALFNLLDHFPDKQFDPANIASYNALIGDEFERIRDFIILHYCISRRDDSPFWQAASETRRCPTRSRSASTCIAPPAAITQRAAGVVHRSRLVLDLRRLGVTPRDYDPLVDTVDFEQVKRLMLAISQKVSADAAAAPDARQLLRPGECEARRRAQGRRRGAIDGLTCHLPPNYWPASNWVAPSACAFSAPGPMTCARSSACPPASAKRRCGRSKPCSIAGVRNTARRARSASPRSVPSICARTRPPTDSSPPPPSPAGATPTSRSGSAAASACPVGFDTDVNGAALAEGRWGAARGLDDFAYVTVGTGIGVGTIVRGRSVFGMNHTELGHIRVARKPGDKFPGVCPFHGDCIEGLASGPAIEARAGMPASQLPPDHPAWDFVAHGLGQLMHTMVLTTAPSRIFLGGGVMSAQTHLFERIQQELKRSLNRYVEAPELEQGLAQFLVPPGLGTMAGPLGALALAADAENARRRRSHPSSLPRRDDRTLRQAHAFVGHQPRACRRSQSARDAACDPRQRSDHARRARRRSPGSPRRPSPTSPSACSPTT